MYYPCAKFDDYIFSRFVFFCADKQTNKQTNRITDAAKRLARATTVGVSKDYFISRN